MKSPQLVPYLFVAAAVLGAPPRAQADKPAGRGPKPLVMAVVGDTPYGAAQVTDFPNLIDAINADADVRGVVHVGDIKNGSSVCSDEYFASILGELERLEGPVYYTPGDNEWTDCHRRAAGKYDPLERLEALRETFFPVPGLTLGADARWTLSQALDPRHRTFRENLMWSDASVVFSTVHVVGSNNGFAPWFGDDTTDALVDDPARREAEAEARTEAAVQWIANTFQLAQLKRAKAVALFMQADMWDAFSVQNGLPLDGFDPIVAEIAERARRFGKPVLVVQGDSHGYLVDHPLAEGSPVHGVTTAAPNVTRLVVQGSTTSEWLKLSVDPTSRDVFSWTRVTR
jgi:Calcineurin-like phosphoesterase